MRLCSVNVDLDDIPHYFGIHGLPEPVGAVRTLVYDVAIDRLLALGRALDVPLTLFAIGGDLARRASAERLRAAREAGCEIGNHTLDHRYDFSRLGRGEIRRQVEEGAAAIERAVGVAPAGFRAPGYTITDEVFDVLGELGVTYDSSVFPCPGYYAAKAAYLGLVALRGRRSQSIIGPPEVLAAPPDPYRVGKPYWRRGQGLMELPIGVTRGARIHFIGTTVTAAGPRGVRLLAQMCVGRPLVNVELHGIDVLDAEDGLEALAPHQLDVRIPRARKVAALRSVVDTLREAGYAFVTLGDAARRLAA